MSKAIKFNPNEPIDPKKMYTVKQTAAFLQAGEDYTRALINKGYMASTLLPQTKVFGQWIIDFMESSKNMDFSNLNNVKKKTA